MSATPASISSPSGVGSLLSSLAGLGGSIYGLVNSANLQGTANTATSNIAAIQAQQLGYANQLQTLMANPSSVTSLPGYQFLQQQGIQAIDRSAAAPGGTGLGSGGEMTALETYGQGLADQFYNQQVSTLANLSGIPSSANALAQALQTSGAASTGLGSSISGLGGAISSLLSPSSIQTISGIGNDISNLFGGGSGFVSDAQIASDAASYPSDISNIASDTDAAVSSDIASSDVGDLGDLSSLFSGFNTAGGVAATAAGTGFSALGSSAASGLGAELGSASSAAIAGELSPALQSIGTGAVESAAEAGEANASSALASNTGGAAGAAGTALGALGAAYSLYNFVNNWQSGSTGSDALSGAETGASVGTMIVPGIGTLIGGLIGGAVGAISSAFGGGKADPETTAFNSFVQANSKSGGVLTSQLNPSQAYQMLAGMMDAKNNTPGHSTPLEEVFGREGEGNFMTQMADQVNSAISSGQVSKSASPETIYSEVVMPWLQQKGAYVPADAIISSNGTKNDGTVDSLITQLIGQWQSGELTGSSKVGISGQTISGLPTFGA